MNERLKRYWGDFLNPLKNVGKYYKEEVDSGLHGMGVGEHETGLGSKALGLLQFAGAPVTAFSKGLLEKPLEGNLVSAGVDPDMAEKIGLYTGMTASVFAPSMAAPKIARAITGNFGNPALTQQITRTSPAHLRKHDEGGTLFRDWYKGGMAEQMGIGVGRMIGDYTQMAFSPQKAYLFKKYGLSPSQVKDLRRQMDDLSDIEAKIPVYQKDMHGRTDRVLDETGQRWKQADPKHVNTQNMRQEFHSTLAYLDSIFRKYMPNDERRWRFLEDVYGHTFPRQSFTRYDDLERGATEPIRKTLDNLPEGVTDDMIREVFNPAVASFAKGKGGLKSSGNISINSKKYWENPSTSAYLKSRTDPSKLYRMEKLWGDMGDTPITKSGLIKKIEEINKNLRNTGTGIKAGKGGDSFKFNGMTANQYENHVRVRLSNRKYKSGANKGKNIYTKRQADKEAKRIANNYRKQLFDKDMFDEHIKDHGDYISIGEELLSRDRLLAHIQNRLIIPKHGNEGIWFTVDQMAQGTKWKWLERLTEAGSQSNFIAVDAFPVVRRIKDGVAEVDVKKSLTGEHMIQSPTKATRHLIDAMDKKLSDRVSPELARKFYGRRGVAGGVGLLGAGTVEGKRRQLQDAY